MAGEMMERLAIPETEETVNGGPIRENTWRFMLQAPNGLQGTIIIDAMLVESMQGDPVQHMLRDIETALKTLYERREEKNPNG